ncbi:PLP-dependent aminotransferase family protein [Klebsiella pneumoniae]
MLRGLGLKTIEIPTDPETGISIEALELALDQWPIKGVILVPNCNNPLGFIMPDARKRAVLNLAQRYDIVIFEDDIYGELATEYPRPRTIHSWDIDGRVMLCSSFTKTIAPGLRIGWIAPRALLRQAATDEVRRQRDQRPLHSAGGLQFIREGHYHRHVRRMRQIYQRNIEIYTCWLREFFPCGICVTRPKGGFMLWVELPEQVDMVCVAKQLCRLKIRSRRARCFRQRASIATASGSTAPCRRPRNIKR